MANCTWILKFQPDKRGRQFYITKSKRTITMGMLAPIAQGQVDGIKDETTRN